MKMITVYYVATSRIGRLNGNLVKKYADKRFTDETEAREYVETQRRNQPWNYTYMVQMLETVKA